MPVFSEGVPHFKSVAHLHQRFFHHALYPPLGAGGKQFFMKNQQQEQAKEFYFQANMSKTEIAEKVGVARKTVLFWSQQGNWDKLRMSARNMPSLVAEKCYYIIDQYINSLLLEGNTTTYSKLQLKHAQTIHLLATTIKKLKNRSTVNESMEMFNFFLDGLKRRDPVLADQVAPQIEQYITIRKNVETTDFLMEDFRHDGTLPFTDLELLEKSADEQDNAELYSDFEDFLKGQKKDQENELQFPNPDATAPQPFENKEEHPNTTTQLNQAA